MYQQNKLSNNELGVVLLAKTANKKENSLWVLQVEWFTEMAVLF